jgi:hypothetical protein
MIEPSHDEIDFIRRIEERGGAITLQGEIRLLKIGRLVPEYVTHASGGSQTGYFSLTTKGWELARCLRITGGKEKPHDRARG